MLKAKVTKKLFYDEYPYKLVVRNSLGHIFRDKNLKNARDELDILQLQYEKGESLRRGSYRIFTYDIPTFKEAKILYRLLKNVNEYKLRVENPRLQIYSHSLSFLQNISKKVRHPEELWMPEVPLDKNTILVNKPMPYNIKVTIQNLNVSTSLAKWIRSNPKLAKAGPVCLSEIEKDGYTNGYYFYVRDEKVLSIVSLMVGNNFRVDKIVCNKI